MYGYEPEKQAEPGGCREVLLFTRLAWGIIVPVLFGIVGGTALICATVFLLFVNPLYSILPGSIVIAGFTYFIIRDRRIQRELEDEGDSRYR